jgi:hypothetical protein
MVVDGYRYVDKNVEGRFLNTDNDGTVAWRRFATHRFDSYFVPNLGLVPRNTDPRVASDADGDGVVDFDEDERFQSDRGNPDTDSDEVNDKNDIRSYTFHRFDHNGHNVLPAGLYDVDGDGLWAENDCDSDSPDAVGGDGDFDGGEDIDGDGNNPEVGETCMFRAADSLITVKVDRQVYPIGWPVYIIPETRTYHANSRYYYELGPWRDCPGPTKANDSPLSHDGWFRTDRGGRARKRLVHFCPGRAWYLTVDVLGDLNYSTPDNTDPQTCWECHYYEWFRIEENFESYEDPGNPILLTWADGGVNGSGSAISLAVDPPDPAVNGIQSMLFQYDNTVNHGAGYYSEASRAVQDPCDWTENEAKSLSLWYYGDPNNDANDTEQMFLALEDQDGNYAEARYGDHGEDMNDIKIPEWQEWNVDQQDFNDSGVDLTEINTLYIGFGDRGSSVPGGTGIVYFDEIRRYPPRCISEHGPVGDFTGDCKVDDKDLKIMADDWLQTDYYTDGEEPVYHPLESLANVYDEEPPGSKIVNFKDYCLFGEMWLTEKLWPE